MGDGPQTYEDLLDQMDTLIEDCMEDIVDKANWAGGKLADAANGVGAFFGDLFGDSEAKKALDKWNDELAPAIQEGVNKMWTEIGKAVGDLAGRPQDLIDFSEAYIAAKATLYTRNSLEQDIAALGFSWDGSAYAAYSTVGALQNDALLALSNNLQEGGKLARAGADSILGFWLDLVDNFMDYSSQAISVIGSCADVGKALGAWISTIADAIALIWGKIGDLALLLGKFFKDQKTQAAMNWELLVAGFDGMPENKWPIITETTSDTMNDPTNWP